MMRVPKLSLLAASAPLLALALCGSGMSKANFPPEACAEAQGATAPREKKAAEEKEAKKTKAIRGSSENDVFL